MSEIDKGALAAAELAIMFAKDEACAIELAEAAIRAYIEAAPSPSPAPGVVADEMVEAALDAYCKQYPYGVEPHRGGMRAALASLSQPAKKEERPVSYHDWLLSTSLSQPAKGEQP